MTKKNDVYKCGICGAMHQALHDGAGDPVCCEKTMIRMKDNYTDAAVEKHIPIVKKLSDGKIEVTVGEVEHPMTIEHYIEWVELKTETTIIKEFLKPGDKPVVIFSIDSDEFEVRAYCNLHGVWKA